jgi:hypothetical protein
MVDMRLSQGVLLALLTAGCLPARQGNDTSTVAHRFPDPAGDMVGIDVAIVERPAGNYYLNRTLWELADEQTVELERKPALDDNGFRAGVIGGLLPADLMALLTSHRSCADPHRIQLRAGNSTPLNLGPEHAQCNFTLFTGDRGTPVALNNARCLLQVEPEPVEGGRTKLRFTPVVKHGTPNREPRVVHDASGEYRWDMEVQQSTETYSSLSWEITVAPEEYIVVGTRLDRDESLGQLFFLDTESATPTQRLLVIRSGRVLSEHSSAEGGPAGAPVPLALQAGWHSVRGAAP